MLTTADERGGAAAVAGLPSGLAPANAPQAKSHPGAAKRSPFASMLRIEWIGQTAASLCWIASVLVYGISSTGDWLQLGAASAWLLANIAAVAGEAD